MLKFSSGCDNNWPNIGQLHKRIVLLHTKNNNKSVVILCHISASSSRLVNVFDLTVA